MWQRAFPRLALNLVPFRVLARPVAPISTTVPHVKHLHDDTKKPDPALDKDVRGSPADNQVEVGTQNSSADSESLGEIARPTTVQKGKKPRSDAQRAASIAFAKKLNEAQRAAGFPNLKKIWEAQRAAGFPNLKKAQEAQRAADFPNLKKAYESLRAADFPNLKKAHELQRAADFPNLRKAHEAQRAAGFPNLKKAKEAQRAAGFPSLKKAQEAQRAAGFPSLKKSWEAQRAAGFPVFKEYHAEQGPLGYPMIRKARFDELLRDIEAANKRKLAEDPAFVPSPLPDLESMPRNAYPKHTGTIPCPEPGCKSKLANERTLATHIRMMHSRCSIDTPHKCKEPSCNRYFPTEKKASQHYYNTHGRPKPSCPVCDRTFVGHANLKRHMGLHGIPPSASVSP